MELEYFSSHVLAKNGSLSCWQEQLNVFDL